MSPPSSPPTPTPRPFSCVARDTDAGARILSRTHHAPAGARILSRTHPRGNPFPRRLPAHAVLLALLIALPACSDAAKRRWTYRSSEENYRLALESKETNLRRDAVVRIAESRDADGEDGFAVLDAVSRTDPVAQIRCIAIRAFAAYDDGRPARTLLAVLQATQNSKEALPPDDDVRWEAALTLYQLERRDKLDDAHRDAACALYIKLMESDPSRNVRIVATQALERFHKPEVLRPLIRSLRDRDFAIADRAERSLIALTGVTHDYDADAWEKWVANAPDPFAHAGETPVTTRPAGPTWWDQQVRGWRRALKIKNPD